MVAHAHRGKYAAAARSVISVHAPVLGQVTSSWTALTASSRGGPT